MNVFLNVIISVVATAILFFIAIAVLKGDLTPYFIIVIFCGVIIGLLITRKVKECAKSGLSIERRNGWEISSEVYIECSHRRIKLLSSSS